MHTPVIEWGRDPAVAPELTQFFIREVNPSYISHSEVQIGRAANFQSWAEGLDQSLESEFREALGDGADSDAEVCIAIARSGTELVAIAIVRFVIQPTRYAVFEDLVVASAHRRQGIGEALIRFAEEEAVRRGAAFMFLESGKGNGGAHTFFKRLGFQECSIVMAKRLHTPDESK